MKIIKPQYFILTPIDKTIIYKQIENAARTCYKSEDKITDTSATKMVKALVKNRHEAMLEHAYISVKFVVDRGVANEMVRHRIASYAQESTRYCAYNKGVFNSEITVIAPNFWSESNSCYTVWKESCEQAEKAYMKLLDTGAKPEEARDVLPLSLKTEIVVTMNLREWRHFLNLRAANSTGIAHPQIREVAVPLLNRFYEEIFRDIFYRFSAYRKPYSALAFSVISVTKSVLACV